MKHSDVTWTAREISWLRSRYADPMTSKSDILDALGRHTWGAIRKKAHECGVRRPFPFSLKADLLVQEFASRANDAALSPRAICEEAGLPKWTANEWLRGRTDPRLSQFDRALRELGFKLVIVSFDDLAAHSLLAGNQSAKTQRRRDRKISAAQQPAA